MEQLKFSLGPYELFAAILGGFPFVLAGFLIYHPIDSLQELIPIIQNNATVAISITVVFISYILGGAIQGITWRYFLFLCNILNRDYRYFGNALVEHNKALAQTLTPDATDFKSLEFEARLILLLRQKIGITHQIDHLDGRLAPYLRERQHPSVIVAESHLANHIMYRSLSLGMLLVGAILFINIFRARAFSLELGFLPLAAIGFAIVTFHRSVTFKRWHNREIFLGFYFAALES